MASVVGLTRASGASPPMTVALPVGSVAGQVVVVQAGDDSADNIPDLSAWTPLVDPAGADYYGRTLDSSEITAGAVAFTAEGAWDATLWVVDSVTTVGGEVVSGDSGGFVSSYAFGGHAAGAAGWLTLHIAGALTATPSSPVTWPGVTVLSDTVDSVFGPYDARTVYGWRVQGSPGTLADATVTPTASAYIAGTTVFLQVVDVADPVVVEVPAIADVDVTIADPPTVVSAVGDVDVFSVPTVFPGPAEPGVTLVGPTSDETQIRAKRLTYGTLTLDSDGKVVGDWGPL